MAQPGDKNKCYAFSGIAKGAQSMGNLVCWTKTPFQYFLKSSEEPIIVDILALTYIFAVSY